MPEGTIHIKILFFATLKELVQQKELETDFPSGKTVRMLKDHLVAIYPQLARSIPYALCSYNHQYVDEDQVIENNAEIGFFPPVSGGNDETNDTVVLTEAKLDFDAILKSLTTNEVGAACVFTGFVRGETVRGNQHKTMRLEYEFYLPMAESKMLQICAEIHEKLAKGQ